MKVSIENGKYEYNSKTGEVLCFGEKWTKDGHFANKMETLMFNEIYDSRILFNKIKDELEKLYSGSEISFHNGTILLSEIEKHLKY